MLATSWRWATAHGYSQKVSIPATSKGWVDCSVDSPWIQSRSQHASNILEMDDSPWIQSKSQHSSQNQELGIRLSRQSMDRVKQSAFQPDPIAGRLNSMKKVNKQCLLDTPRTVRVSKKTWQVIVQTRRP